MGNDEVIKIRSVYRLDRESLNLLKRKYFRSEPDICVCSTFAAYLSDDGKVSIAGKPEGYDGKVSGFDKNEWIDIIKLSAGRDHIVGLRLDGTAVAAGDNSKGQCDIRSWTDIRTISTGTHCTTAVTNDGKTLFCGRFSGLEKSAEKETNKAVQFMNTIRALPKEFSVSQKRIFDYKQTSDSEKITITKYNGNLAEVIVPAVIDGKKVVNISSNAFSWCSSIVSLTVSEGVMSIGENVFSNCKKLSVVKLPESLESIGKNTFENCTSIERLTLPSKIKTISRWLFSGCTSLKSVVIPDGVLSIGSGAFMNCTALKAINVPSSVSSIHDSAFDGCENVVFIGKMDSYAEQFASRKNFNFRDSGVNVRPDFSENSPGSGQKSSFIFNIDSYNNLILESYVGQQSKVVIPQKFKDNQLKIIGNKAFFNSKNLSEVVIPEGVTIISVGAFSICGSLQDITFPSTLKTIGIGAFNGCRNLKKVVLPDGLKSLCKNAFRYCVELSEIIVPDSVTEIGESVFSECAKLVIVCSSKSSAARYARENGIKLRLTDEPVSNRPTVEKNPQNPAESPVTPTQPMYFKYEQNHDGTLTILLFSGKQTTVVVPAVIDGHRVTRIGRTAFEHKRDLKSVILPPGIVEIGDSAFYNCSSLTQINIPDTVKTFGSLPFLYCNKLTIVCSRGSAAADYANKNYINCRYS